jgi:hypothetical protein
VNSSLRAAVLAAATVATIAVAGPAAAAPAPLEGSGPTQSTPAAAANSTVGKVFFTANGRQYECTGNVVQSQNRDTISTAGSCLFFRATPTDLGTYVADFRFVPGYHRGERPYGSWKARQLAVTESWQAGNGNNVGFAVLATRGGKHIQDVVGGTAVQFNKTPPNAFQVSGYNLGRTALTSCGGETDATNYPQLICNLGNAGNGAPWLVDGVQVSSTLGTQDGVIVGSAWTDEVKGTYDYAQYR